VHACAAHPIRKKVLDKFQSVAEFDYLCGLNQSTSQKPSMKENKAFNLFDFGLNSLFQNINELL
jgi:hypothetical protein